MCVLNWTHWRIDKMLISAPELSLLLLLLLLLHRL
jgi:hypothetical protein